MIRILLTHKSAFLRGALAAVLSDDADMDVIAELSEGDDVLPTAIRERPGVTVLDPDLIDGASIAALCRTLSAALPDSAVLVMLDRRLSLAVGGELARLAPRVGLIATDASPAELVESVRLLARGEPVLDVRLALAALTAQENPLTGREREVLRLAVDGAPVVEIAKRLRLGTGTVRNYLSRIVTKTGARTRLDAIRIAQDAGWI